MIISDFAIKRPLITVVAMVAMVIFGIFALLKLKTDEFPDVAPPWLTVGIIYPGASPDVVESEVLKPVEEQIGSIAGVKRIMGKAYDGYSMLMIEFLFDKDLNVASQEVRDAISKIRTDLPPEMKEPIVSKFNDTDRPIISMAISSTVLGPAELTRLADPGITRELRAIPGVADVQIFGKVERELTVEVDPHKLQAANISIAQVAVALQSQNLAAPVGRVNGTLDERAIRLKGRLENPAEFENLVVAERNGQLIRLGQVATIKDGTVEPRTLALYNGKEAIAIDVKKSKGYSTTDVAARIVQRLEEIKTTLPPGTKINVVKDSGVRVTNAVKNVEEALILGALLTVLVVFAFLNSWRSTVITGVALPISVLASFIAVWALGFNLETMSLLGLSLAIGILIDDAIVVRENIVRHVEMGKDHFTAAHDGTDEIGLAVAATTFSILAVFDPMLSAYWADPHKLPHERAWITRQLDKFNAWFNHQALNYKKVIAWALDHRAAMVATAVLSFFASFFLAASGLNALGLAVVGIVLIVIGLSADRLHGAVRTLSFLAGAAVFLLTGSMAFAGKPFELQPLRKVGTAFFPEDDRAEFIMAIETPPGSNMEYTRLKAAEAARVAKAHPEVTYTYTTLGNQATGGVDEGNIYVRLVPKSDRKVSVEKLAEELRHETASMSGAAVSVFTSDFSAGFKAIQLQLRGQDVVALAQAADMVKAEVQKIPGAVDIGLSTKGQKPELEIDLNRGVAGTLGLTVGQVAQSLRPAFAGIDAGYWIDPSGKSRKVTVRLTPESRQRAADLVQLPMMVLGPNGVPSMMPLGQVATVHEGLGPAIIDHLNREPVVTVELNTAGRAAGDVTKDIEARLAKMQLPAGVHYTIGGDAESQAEVFGQIFSALGLAILLMYLILVVQFGSFVDPLAILMSLPLSLIGVMLSLAISGMTINIMSLIGVILLMGIVAKNAILLIDFAKWAREERGLPLREALIEAGAIRLRPILMTTFALIAGMLPVAMGLGEGADFRAPLGRAVIGGTITSTLLTLFVIPTVYEILDDWRERAAARVRRRRGAEHEVPVHGKPAVPALGD